MKKRQINQYDKIFRENIEAIVPTLIEKVLGIHAIEIEELPDEIQATKERKPDVLKKIKDDKHEVFILQIEFQLANDAEMLYRMLEYHSMLLRKYRSKIKQFVIFLGQGKTNMQTQFSSECLIFHYNLLSFKDINAEIFLNSQKPEEIILALLSNFEQKSSAEIIQTIIQKVEETSETELVFNKHIQQLRILAKLRNLQLKTDEIMESILKYIDEENDILFKKGIEKGIEKGVKEGFIQGIEQEKFFFVKYLLQNTSHPITEIAQISNTSIQFVEEVKGKIKN